MSVLDDILAGVAEDLQERMAHTDLDDLKAQAAKQHPALDPMPAFRWSISTRCLRDPMSSRCTSP